MPAKVMLKVIHGKISGKEFVFDEPDTCILGRADDCHPRVPNDEEHTTISRHHCLLDINPPDIRIRDFGSLNGTYVDGQVIGRRGHDESPEDAQQRSYPEHDLDHGSQLRLGDTVFEVSIYSPAVCMRCASEIPDVGQAAAQAGPDQFECNACRETIGRTTPRQANLRTSKRCRKCGRDVSDEVGERRHGEHICTACQKDPEGVLKMLLDLARSDKKDNLESIRGFEVIKPLGKGAQGIVYLARHERSGELVALKMMLPQVAVDPRAKNRFLSETDAMKTLKHPHITEMRGAGCSNGVFFLTLEYCDGGSVDNLLKKANGPLTLKEAAPIILQTLDGLEYAHQAPVWAQDRDGHIEHTRGLVHRDIKPQNILLSGRGNSRVAKLSDFGLAKAFEMAGLSGGTRTGDVAGTPVFMCRQQVIRFKYAKPDVDVWAVAASLYNLLTASYPRDFTSGRDRWRIVLESPTVPIRKRNAALPHRVAELIDQALDDRESLHFQSAAQFKQALEGVL